MLKESDVAGPIAEAIRSGSEYIRNDKLEALIALEKGGSVEPLDLVEAARDKAHPYHHEFEWDDRIAAHHHRLYQARKIIAGASHWLTEDVRDKGRRVNVGAFLRDPSKGPSERGYVSIDSLLKDKSAAKSALLYRVRMAVGNVRAVDALAVDLKMPKGVKNQAHEWLKAGESLMAQLE